MMNTQLVTFSPSAAVVLASYANAVVGAGRLVELTDSELHALPNSVKELVLIIGQELALRFVSVFGGINLTIPKGVNKHGCALAAALEDVIGREALAKMQRHWSGNERFYVPNCLATLNQVRDRQIRQEFDRMTVKEKQSANYAVMLLAVRYRLSDRRVWIILKQA